MTQQQIQLLIPLLVVIPILALRWRRIGRPRPLAWGYLWVRPLAVVIVAAIMMVLAPPLVSDLPWLVLALLLGAAAGWQWGRAMRIDVHPENGTLMVTGSNIAMLVIAGLILLRLALKAGLTMEASAWHIDVTLITDALICSSAGVFTLRAAEMYMRARKVMENAPPAARAAGQPRRWVWIVSGAAALLVVAAGVSAWFWGGTRLHAFVCPSCAGFVRASDHVYVQRGASTGQRGAALAAIADGEGRVRDFFGRPQGHPRFYVCVSDACYARFNLGKTLGSQFLFNAIALAPHGINGAVAAHEATHVETAARVGIQNYYGNGNIPEWFKEGLAVVAARDARYLPPAVPDACPAGPDDLPHTSRYWSRAVARDRMVYADAACLVRRELRLDGGVPALLSAFDRVRRGDGFAQAWKP